MFKKTAPVLLLGTALLAFSIGAMAQDGGKGSSKGGTSVVPTVAGGSGRLSIESLITQYTGLAGSTENATSLVNGLRTGDPITLVGAPPPLSPPPPAPPPLRPGSSPPPPTLRLATPPPPVTITFTPPTGNMGLGNVDIALALTQALMTQNEVKKADPRQLYAALMGANGILTQRAQGTGWPVIAKSLGLELK